MEWTKYYNLGGLEVVNYSCLGAVNCSSPEAEAEGSYKLVDVVVLAVTAVKIAWRLV